MWSWARLTPEDEGELRTCNLLAEADPWSYILPWTTFIVVFEKKKRDRGP